MKKTIIFLLIINSLVINAQWVPSNGNSNVFFNNTSNQPRVIWKLLSKGNTLYACSDGGIFTSDDLGNTWSLRNNHQIGDLISVGNGFYAAGASGSAFFSNDNCNNFTQLHYSLNNDRNAIGVLGSTIISGNVPGVFISHDNGITWTQNYLWGTPVYTISVCGTNIYAAGWLSTDSGNTWNSITNPSISDVSYSNNSTLLFKGYSNDCGLTVNNFTSYPNYNLSTLMMDGSTIFAGTGGGGGIFYSTNFGITWTSWNDGLPALTSNNSIKSISINNGTIFISLDYNGVWSRSLSSFLNTGTELNRNMNSMSVYPNPTDSKFNIDFGNQTNFIGKQVKITNLLGQEIYNSIINQQIIEIPLSSIVGRGLYFVSIINDENKIILTKKIILN